MAQQLGSNYYNSPFKFNGKELDEETGFYYYGARYYDPKISIWLSIDPLAEKFPNFNPNNYVMQNPLNLIDPTGMSPEEGGNDPIKNLFNVGCGKNSNNAGFFWNDLDKKTLFDFVKKNYCPSCSDGKVQQMAGTKFENAFHNVMTKQLKEFGYTSNKTSSKEIGEYNGKERKVIPDGKFDLLRNLYLEVGGVKTTQKVGIQRFKGVLFAEVKAVDGKLYGSNNRGQLYGMLTAMLSNPIVQEFGGDFVIGTTSDTELSDTFITSAKGMGISIQHFYSKYRINSDGQMEISFYDKGTLWDSGSDYFSILK